MGCEQEASAVATVNPRDHIGLVHLLAREYSRKSGESVEELSQAGMTGLMQAATKFDPAKGTFASWAGVWIRSAMRLHIRDRRCFVHVPSKKYDRGLRVATPASMDAVLTDRFDFGANYFETFHDLIADESSPNAEAEAAKQEERDIVRREVDRLPKRTGAMLRAFLDGASLADIGREHGLSRSRIGQIIERAFEILRPRLAAALGAP